MLRAVLALVGAIAVVTIVAQKFQEISLDIKEVAKRQYDDVATKLVSFVADRKPRDATRTETTAPEISGGEKAVEEGREDESRGENPMPVTSAGPPKAGPSDRFGRNTDRLILIDKCVDTSIENWAANPGVCIVSWGRPDLGDGLMVSVETNSPLGQRIAALQPAGFQGERVTFTFPTLHAGTIDPTATARLTCDDAGRPAISTETQRLVP